MRIERRDTSAGHLRDSPGHQFAYSPSLHPIAVSRSALTSEDLAFFVVFSALVFWAAGFGVFFASQGTSPLDFLLGHYETPPQHLNTWLDVGIEQPSGLLRQERLLFPPKRQNGPFLLRQVRYRDPTSGEIVKIAPEERVRRRRVSARQRD